MELKARSERNAFQDAELVGSPTKEGIEEAELDVEVLPASECKFVMHERAAEVCPSSFLF